MHWQINETNTKLNCIFPDKPMIAFRRPKSLKDILVRAKVKPRQDRGVKAVQYIKLPNMQIDTY